MSTWCCTEHNKMGIRDGESRRMEETGAGGLPSRSMVAVAAGEARRRGRGGAATTTAAAEARRRGRRRCGDEGGGGAATTTAAGEDQFEREIGTDGGRE